jgi:hypothetical protein
MFYKKEDVDSVLVCSLCSEILRDPRILPCGESACHECIQVRSDANSKLSHCPNCQKSHTPSSKKNGFVPNLALVKLVQSKAENVSRDQKVEHLRAKLEEMRTSCEGLDAILSKGCDQVKEHCIELRNQVQLETELFIEQVYALNKELIADIDNYERECVTLYEERIGEIEASFAEHSNEMTEFHYDVSKYLNEFKIDEKKIENSLLAAHEFLLYLKHVEDQVKSLVFDGKHMNFNKNETAPEKSLLGSFDFRLPSLRRGNLKQIQFEKKAVQDFKSGLNLFKMDRHSNVAFYIDQNYKSNLVTFDNQGEIVDHLVDLFPDSETCAVKIATMKDNFVVNVLLNYNKPISSGFHYRDHVVPGLADGANDCVAFLVDKNWDYVNHVALSAFTFVLAANHSSVMFVDVSYNCYIYDSSLSIAQGRSLGNIRDLVGQTISDVQMNDSNVFVLCVNRRLKVLDLKKFDLVAEVSVEADRMKLVSARYLALLDSNSRMLTIYNHVDLSEEDQIDLRKKTEAGLVLARDSSHYISFYDKTQMKFFYF